MKRAQGVSLVELSLLVAILGIIALAAVPNPPSRSDGMPTSFLDPPPAQPQTPASQE